MLGGLLSREPIEERAQGWGMWDDWTASNGSNYAGMSVNRDTSLQLLAVHGSVRVISEAISTLPIDTYRKQGDQRVPTTPPRWVDRPNIDLDTVDFLSQVTTSLLLNGNSFSHIGTDRNGQIAELIPIDDAKVRAEFTPKGTKQIIVDGRTMPRGSVLHIPGMMLAGSASGLSPLEYARQSIGLGLAALEYGAGWFDRDGNMPGIIEMAKPARSEQMTSMAQQWRRMRTRSGKGLPGVLDDGATWKMTGITSEQLEFLATRKWTASEIASAIFLLDASEIGAPVEGSSLTYSNMEQRNVRRVMVTFLPHIVRIEKALSGLLVNKQFVKLNVDSLLRGDAKSRYDGYKIGLEGGWLTLDEIRQMEDRRPLTDAEKEALKPPAPAPAVPGQEPPTPPAP